jgi:hypothetical protein
LRRVIRLSAALLIAVVVISLWAGMAVADPEDSLAACAACHAHEVQEWSASTHSSAGQSTAFLSLADAGPETAMNWPKDDCLRCHSPLRESDPSGLPGVACQVCHGVESLEGIGNGGFRLASDGILRGATARQTPHVTVALDILAESRFCAACHEQYHPVTGVPLQTTYSEWLNSSAAATRQTCQDCHMRKDGGVSHSIGSGDMDSAAKAEALGRAISLDVQSPETETAGRYVALEVILLNEGAGHALPTGKNESGEMWLECTATTDDGKVLYEETLPYGVVYNDANGKHDTPLNLWDAAGIFSDHRLPPGRSVKEQFAFAVPVETRGDVRVDVALMYRAVPSWLTERLSLPTVDAFPIHTASVTLRAMEPPPAPTYVAPTPLPTPLPLPTASSGTTMADVKTEERGWLVPFLAAGVALLIGVAFWALRRRAV